MTRVPTEWVERLAAHRRAVRADAWRERVYRAVLALVFICLVGGLWLGSTYAMYHSSLPEGAVNVRERGDGWVYFELDGKAYLGKRSITGRPQVTCIGEAR